MKPEERIDYAHYRIATAWKTYEAAMLLARAGFWNSAINRLYYSAFYAVNALLVMHEIQTKSHSTTKSQFAMHFIKTGKIDKKYGKLFTRLFDWRQKGDYDNIFDFKSDTVEPLFTPVEELIRLIEKEINKNL